MSGVLKRIAVKLSKSCNDLRLLSSGPRAGLGEINLPPVQAGSSIMPGKVNPVIPEVVNQVAFEVIGNDVTITMAAEAGQLQLNAFEPIILHSLSESITHLRAACLTLAERCVDGITANTEALRASVENSIGLVTALNPHIGYTAATDIAKEALATGRGVAELVLEKGLLPAGRPSPTCCGPRWSRAPAHPWPEPGDAHQDRPGGTIAIMTSAMTFQPVLERIADEIGRTPGRGRPADYIPALAARDPRSFGMAVAELDGTVYGVGDWREPFSTQSITKVFTLALDLAREGDELWEHVGREPSGNPFNSLVQLEYENGIPRNPFINAGALVVTDRLHTRTGDAAGELLTFLRSESGNPDPGLRQGGRRLRGRPRRPQRRPRPLHGVVRQHRQPRPGPARPVLPPVLRHRVLRRPRPRHQLPGPPRRPRRRHPPADPEPGQAGQRGDADLRHVRRGGRVRLPRGPARQERRGRRHHRGRARPLHAVRVEPRRWTSGATRWRAWRPWTASRR